MVYFAELSVFVTVCFKIVRIYAPRTQTKALGPTTLLADSGIND